MNIISRADWGFDGWLSGVSPATVPLSERTEFMIHYDGGTAVGGSTGATMVQGIQAFHKNSRGWAGIGYNFVIDQNGSVFEGRGWDLQGAHCPNHNRSAIGVQIHIGGDEQPSPAALASAVALYDDACSRTGRTLVKLGHRDGFATDCPGNILYAWVTAGMPLAHASTILEDSMIRFTCSGVTYMCSLSSGAFYTTPNNEFDGVVLAMPGVSDKGELNARQRDILHDMCARAVASNIAPEQPVSTAPADIAKGVLIALRNLLPQS